MNIYRAMFVFIYCLTTIILCSSSPSAYAQNTAQNLCSDLGLSSCPQPFDQNIPDPKLMLQWDKATRVVGFRNTYRTYAGDPFKPSTTPPYPLRQSVTPLPHISYTFEGELQTLEDYLTRQNVTGLLILKNGHKVLEHYAQGNTPTTLWTSRSVAKSIVSILIGAAIKEGHIGAVTDNISDYIPELAGSAWAPITLHQLMQHTSGIQWNEDYTDPTSDFSQMTLCEAGDQPYACIFTLVKNAPKVPDIAPGEVWSYTTGGAWLVGLVLERATKMAIAQYLEQTIWQRFGMEHEGIWHALIKNQVNMGGHGFNATLRDWGRFGQFVAQNGRLQDGTALLPEDWIQRASEWSMARNSVTEATPQGQYGYQWWTSGIDPSSSTEPKTSGNSTAQLWAFGIYGQVLMVNPAEALVVVQWSTWEQAETPDALYEEQVAFINALTEILK